MKELNIKMKDRRQGEVREIGREPCRSSLGRPLELVEEKHCEKQQRQPYSGDTLEKNDTLLL